jgi:hypothetical protein
MSSLTAFLAAAAAATPAAKHHYHVDWTAVAAVAALLSSFAAILVAVFNPWIGYTKARLDLLTEKLEKLYQLVKEERREGSEMMFHYVSNIPAKTDGARELEKPAEDFRKFKESNADAEVLIDLFFPEFSNSSLRCQACQDQFVIRWYDMYNYGIESHRVGDSLTTEAEKLFKELLRAQTHVVDSYDLLERDIKSKARALVDQRTATGIINMAFGDLFKGFAKKTDKNDKKRRTLSSPPFRGWLA